ncbi:MAG: arylsulfatase [Candidatus Hydrogenedentota bacterium]
MTSRNVLWIISDQFRGDCLGVAGNSLIHTPNLDALARDGVFFKNCFVQTAPCGPSRMSMYTSRYLCSTRAVRNFTPLADAHENIAMHVRRASYRPVLFGYNDYTVDPRILPDDDPRRTSLAYDNALPGFDVGEYFEYHSPAYFEYLRQKGYPDALCGPCISTEYDVPDTGLNGHLPLRYPAHYRSEDSTCGYLTGRAIEWIADAKQPGWFLNLNLIKPHPPRICAAPYHALYEPQAMPAPARCEAELRDPHPYMRRVRPNPLLSECRDLQETQANYYGMISEVDECVGRLVEALKCSGHWDNTIIVFMSDHGEYLGDHYLQDKGHYCDGGMHVPLIVRDPDTRADGSRGSVYSGLVEAIDVAPTIVDCLGLPIPEGFQGKSLKSLLYGETARHRAEIHFEFDFRAFAAIGRDDPETCLLWVIRDERFKYVQFGVEDLPSILFDLERDPRELENRAGDPLYSGVVLDFCQRLLRWRMRNEDQRMERWASNYR